MAELNSPSLIDAEILEGLRELTSDDDPQFVKRYFTAFLDGLPAHFAGVRDALRTNDARRLATHAHAIKSSCANSGVVEMTERCGKIEAMGHAGDTSQALPLVEEIEALHKQLEAEVRALPEMN
ncbi:MAG: Hpt domain-containing protein [Proteobacteria bacterium]|nr:MAG: Hpt domain-containing protein [Pseudomonadota bacterium]